MIMLLFVSELCLYLAFVLNFVLNLCMLILIYEYLYSSIFMLIYAYLFAFDRCDQFTIFFRVLLWSLLHLAPLEVIEATMN